ncbi:M48 family metalloprotease [Halomonas garicola]|uniref:M48 family metalloprotease n=1 Tax=Halomonas garicola TaxID=1690008 RepID=UPI0028A10041|nr:M48 family metalloprotease [Halomonas garicola]
MSRLRHASCRLCAVALAVSLPLSAPASAATTDYHLPSLGGVPHAASSKEARLGRAWLRQFRAQAPQWQDPIAHYYLDRLIARLAPHSGISGQVPISVMVNNDSLNAFAVPGGVIGINAGLYAFAPDEGAFASVLAHELGHLAQRHFARGSERAGQTQLPTMAAMLAGMVLAASGAGSAGLATAMGSQAAMLQDQLRYSRRFEQEADRVGMKTLADAGYPPDDMVRMFKAMQRMARLQGDTPPEFLLSHPVSESRLSDAQSRAAQLQVADTHRDDTLYDMVRARALMHLHANAPQQALITLRQDDATDAAITYLEALIDADRGQTQSALDGLDRLAEQHPDLGLLPASAASIALDARRVDDAIARSQRLLRFMPGYLPAQLTLAEAQLGRDPRAAYRLLRDVTAQHPEDPAGFTLLAEAAGGSGHPAEGRLARAEYLQLTGRIDKGIRQLDLARDAARGSNNPGLEARIESRREAFIEYRDALDEFS